VEYFKWAADEKNIESSEYDWNAKKMDEDLREAVKTFKRGDLGELEEEHVRYHTYVQRNMDRLNQLMNESSPQKTIEQNLSSRIANTSYQLNQICRCGIGMGQEDQIGAVCDTMVILAQGDASKQYMYERGLVYALSKKYAEAKTDFEIYKKWLESVSGGLPARQEEGAIITLQRLDGWLKELAQEPPHFELRDDEVRHAYKTDCSREPAPFSSAIPHY
jgi:hypothetical protein